MNFRKEINDPVFLEITITDLQRRNAKDIVDIIRSFVSERNEMLSDMHGFCTICKYHGCSRKEEDSPCFGCYKEKDRPGWEWGHCDD